MTLYIQPYEALTVPVSLESTMNFEAHEGLAPRSDIGHRVISEGESLSFSLSV